MSKAELRLRAEAAYRERLFYSGLKKGAAAHGTATPESVLHELHVHQIELEMQNDELLRTQRELEESRAKYFELYDLAPVGYCTVDQRGVLCDVNLTAARILGDTRQTMVGRPFSHYIVHEDQDHFYLFQRRLQDADAALSIELRLQRRDNATIIAQLDAALADGGPDEALLRVVVTDITDRRRLERKLQETQKLESLGVLAGGIAHDFNNLLTGILGNASLARLELPADSPIQAKLETIKVECRRAAELCSQMLAYSGHGRFAVKDVSLNDLVHEMTHALKLAIRQDALLRINLHAALPPIPADATQLRQVIMNLVINASEAIGETGGVISLTTSVTRIEEMDRSRLAAAVSLAAGNYVVLEVSDSGCGMDQETLAKIFDPFFTTKFSGRGLGLSAVQGIVRGHHGALTVESQPGRGTTFRLLFPVGTRISATVREPAAPEAAWTGTGCILMAEDEDSVRGTLGLMLEMVGFEVVSVADGREAVAAFRAEPDRFTLVLTDLTMPHLDGDQVAAELRKIRPDVRVVIMSGYDEHELASRFSRGGSVEGFIQKPFEFEQLCKVLRSAMAARATRPSA